MNSVIVLYTKKNGQIDINNSLLCIGSDEYKIQHLTKGGYFSKSALMPFFEYVETSESGQQCLFVTEEVAQMIVQSNCNLKGKIWDNHISTCETVAERMNDKYEGVNLEWFK